MKIRVLPLLLAATLTAPPRAVAGEALAQARAASSDPANFDGGRARFEGNFMALGATTTLAPPGADQETGTKKPNKYFNADLVTSAVKGSLIGLLVGSLFGPPGLIAGPVIGAALFYGLTKITA